VVDHPRITIIKEEEEEGLVSNLLCCNVKTFFKAVQNGRIYEKKAVHVQ
jgi:hypothetical protein